MSKKTLKTDLGVGMSDQSSWPGLINSLGKPIIFLVGAVYCAWGVFAYSQAPIGSQVEFFGASVTKGDVSTEDETKAEALEQLLGSKDTEINRLKDALAKQRLSKNEKMTDQTQLQNQLDQAQIELTSVRKRAKDLILRAEDVMFNQPWECSESAETLGKIMLELREIEAQK